MKPSINQIMTTFMDCAGPKDFDSILRKFNAFNTEDRHWIRCRICRLVKQKYIIKVAVNEWVFNDAYRDLRARVDEEARRNFADSSVNGRLQIQLLGMLAEWEREIISDRTREALAQKRDQGVKLGRPPTKLPIHTIALMRVAGKTWREISKELDVAPTTVKNHRREICREIEEIRKVVKD